jgi:lysophospholipase L1-like esterase
MYKWILIAGLMVGACTANAQNGTISSHEQATKIVLVGDSTVATEGGWGPAFCAETRPGVACQDLALNGRSTKSFLDEGAWKKALAEKGQYYFIQFGHNDQKPDPTRHADAATDYAANLRRYIADVRAIHGTPVIVSSLSRRNYRDGKLVEDGLREYAASARRVAEEEKVPFIDLFALSTGYLTGLTQEQADRFNAATNSDAANEKASNAKPDRTHLNDSGKAVFGEMVAREVIRTQPQLRQYLKTPSN